MRWYSIPDNRVCPVCKITFERSYGTAQEYCSVACKQKAYRQRKKALRQSGDKSVTFKVGQETT